MKLLNVRYSFSTTLLDTGQHAPCSGTGEWLVNETQVSARVVSVQSGARLRELDRLAERWPLHVF
jgi:hypothetical protein